jgi:ABC-type transport system involved in cytochrome c biogenesis permease subunit
VFEFDSTFFFFISTIGYFFAFLCYLIHTVFKPRMETEASGDSLGITATSGLKSAGINWGQWGSYLTWLTMLIAFVGVVMRTLELGMASKWVMSVFLPVTTTYETLTFFAWLIPLAYLIIERMHPIRSVGVFVTGFAFTLLVIAASPALAPSTIAPVVPSLQSYWLVIHVLSMIIGIAFFSVSFGGAIVYMYRRSKGLDFERVEEMVYRSIALGFPFYGIGGLVFGGIWAKEAWGMYWEWDPKETAMLAAWLVYAVYLHQRVRKGPKSWTVAWLAIAGFLAVMYAWVGINYFVGGLHSFT